MEQIFPKALFVRRSRRTLTRPLIRGCGWKQYHIDRLGPFDTQGWPLMQAVDRFEVFSSEALILLNKREELVAEPRDMFLHCEPLDVFRSPPVTLLPFRT